MENGKFKDNLSPKPSFLSILTFALLPNLILAFSPLTRVYAASKEAPLSTSKQIVLSSSAFKQGQNIPQQYTADGENISPPLSWTRPPAGTKSFALICEDPDAPAGTWIHWLIYDIPASKTNLVQGILPHHTLTDGTNQGINSFHRIGYGGPSPPPGSPHRYFFKLYALNTLSGFKPGINLVKFRQLVAAHKIIEAQLMGVYGR